MASFGEACDLVDILKMDKDLVLATLKANADKLRSRGVERVGLYGSTARGEATASSDVDLLLSLCPRSISLFELAGLQEELEQLLGRTVDLTTTPITNPFLAREINHDLIVIF
jgi:hypothetical protein